MTKMKIAPEDRPKVKLECLRMIVTMRLNPARAALIGGFMNRYLRLTQSEAALYNEEVATLAPPERTNVMAITNEWAVERVVGIEIRQLEHRFGPVSPKLRSAVEQLSYDALDELATAILDFKSLTEAEVWIARHQQDPSSAR